MRGVSSSTHAAEAVRDAHNAKVRFAVGTDGVLSFGDVRLGED